MSRNYDELSPFTATSISCGTVKCEILLFTDWIQTYILSCENITCITEFMGPLITRLAVDTLC